jgi:hypothetical protein
MQSACRLLCSADVEFFSAIVSPSAVPKYSSITLLVVVPLECLDITNTDVDVFSVLKDVSSLVKVVTPLRIKRAPTAHHDMICTQITARPERL